ncbi:hypothetical protein Tsubulata_051009 [Turnera subulata]|uniref:Receptor-like serine/threonine-protein kinase n=1 Tax=Turnera subulata TaxID=218843 RepID=A0A9Q0G1T7_9ROSI|nr:hypothetical protein Tsubulata_051009 [Turnera subulata]
MNPICPICLFFPFLVFFFITFSSSLIIPLGSSISASNPNQTWSSPNSTFYLGFTRLTPSTYAAAVHYSGGVPIWTPGPAVDSGATFRLLPDGDLRLLNGSGAPVWTTGTASLGVASASLDDSGDLVLRNRIGFPVWSSFANPTDILVPNQNLTVNQSLNSGWYSFQLLSYNDTSSAPICGCPSENFVLVDVNDRRKGCKRKVELQLCSGNQTMLPLDHAMFFTYQPEPSSQNFVGISACRSSCLNSGSCVASTSLSDGTGLCYLKNSGFISGYKNPALPSTSYMKVCGPVQPNPSPDVQILRGGRKGKLGDWIAFVVFVAILLFLIVVEGALWWYFCRNSPKFGASPAQYALLEYASGAPVPFSYRELQRSTRGFKEKLGAGGFGAVYKGVLANKTVVAVKQLEGIEHGEKQFTMELATISCTHHLNLVRLIGFCSEGRHRLLVYEFMENGSLDNFLFGTEKESGKLLSWEDRFNIALGTARGITYLHQDCGDYIIHCDIKPENILLDGNYNAKVSDFGLAELINPKDHRHRTLTSVRGTRGYLAPEWLANLEITSKSDVYSFGMVLLEIVSGRRNFDVSEETNWKKFSLWAYEEYDKGNVTAILDKRLAAEDVDVKEVTRAIEVSFWCSQEQPSRRPTMGRVVQMLEGVANYEKPSEPKVVTEGSVSGASVNISSNVSTLSNFASAPVLSSSSSHLTIGVSDLTLGNKFERASCSLLHSAPS